MKWFAVLVTTLVLMVYVGGVYLQLQAEVCEYDGLQARCGELLLQVRKNYQTNELHWLTEDLRRQVVRAGGSIVMDDDVVAVIIVRFGREAGQLATTLDSLRRHPAVEAADYHLISVTDDEFRID